MKKSGNLLYAQSGGPTAVINSSVQGALETARKCPQIEHIYAAYHGVEGILAETLFELGLENKQETAKLKSTPGAALGSCRYKLHADTDADFAKVLAVFQKYNIRYFLYNGGNDSMDTCSRLAAFFKQVDYECYVIGVPKTIDNDLVETDHCPGYASSARFISTMISEVACDANSYTSEQIIVFEIMGRNAGWLAASSSLARLTGFGPDLIYLPEVVFDIEKFIEEVQALRKQKRLIIIAVAESLHLADGRFITDLSGEDEEDDVFGHKQQGGAGHILAEILKKRLNTKVRGIEFSLLQRAANHLASEVDLCEAYQVGREAVLQAVNGVSGKMVTIKRKEADTYETTYGLVDLDKVANAEKLVPREWINEAGNDVTADFINYCLPLISNIDHAKAPLELKLTSNGLPDFAKLERNLL